MEERFFYIFISGVFSGAILMLILLRSSVLVRVSGESYGLKIPLFGIIHTLRLAPYNGIFTEDWTRLSAALKAIKGKIDIERMFRYAQEYGIDYIGFDGDRPDGSWSSGKFAFCTMSRSHRRPYSIYMNPAIDTERVAAVLSVQLRETIRPSDVYPFLFLHEVGHTQKAGNRNFFAAVINYTISGDRHSLRKRRELFQLKTSIEQFADRFALRELPNLR